MERQDLEGNDSNEFVFRVDRLGEVEMERRMVVESEEVLARL